MFVVVLLFCLEVCYLTKLKELFVSFAEHEQSREDFKKLTVLTNLELIELISIRMTGTSLKK
jgi:hypothetical protein